MTTSNEKRIAVRSIRAAIAARSIKNFKGYPPVTFADTASTHTMLADITNEDIVATTYGYVNGPGTVNTLIVWKAAITYMPPDIMNKT
jgi:hypothetical protein